MPKARRVREVARKRPRDFDSNRARKFGRKVARQEIATPRGRPYVPIHRTYTPELLANGKHRYENTAEPVAAIASDFRIHAGSLRRLAGDLGWVRFNMGPRDVPAASRLLAKAEALERALKEGTLPANEMATVPEASPQEPAPGRAQARPGREAEIPVDPEAARAARAARMIDDLETEVAAELAGVRALRQQLAGMPRRVRDGETTARTLSALTHTWQTIQRMRCALNPAARDDDDDMPQDIDAFREALARKIEVFMESRPDEDFAEDLDAEGDGEVRP